MGWVYFLAGLFVGNLTAFVAIVLAQSMRRSEEIVQMQNCRIPVSEPPM
jgi:hypothetical protein